MAEPISLGAGAASCDGNDLATRLATRGIPDAADGFEEPAEVAAQDDRDRRGARRCGRSAVAVSGLSEREARPGDVAGEGEVVEPLRVVVDDARRQHVAFPRGGRDLEALELGDRIDEELKRIFLAKAQALKGPESLAAPEGGTAGPAGPEEFEEPGGSGDASL